MSGIERLLRSLSIARWSAGAAGAEAHGARHVSEGRDGESLLDRLARMLRVPGRVVVAGSSMVPTLVEGDRCLVRRTRRVGPSDLVVVSDPEQPARLVVKRVVTVGAEGIEVAGDNPAASRDSRSFGPVPRRSVLGVAWYRYAPPGRVGRLR